MEDAHISKLPNDILKIIFCKLPITTLLQQCRYVCKSWRDILCDPDFAKLQLQPNSQLVLFMKDTSIHWLEFQGSSCYFQEITEVVLQSEIELVNSCNGLLCVYQQKTSLNDQLTPIHEEFLHILNPVTGEYITLPPANEDRDCNNFVCGLGFSNETRQFKVVKICEKMDVKELDAEVCTIGTGFWRNIGDVTYYNNSAIWFWRSYDAFVNGCFHFWVAQKRHPWSASEICAFDFESEQFRSISLPVAFNHRNYDLVNIGVFEETIFWSYIGENLEVWVLEEYGVVESWTKTLVLEIMNPENNLWFWNHDVSEDGELLLSDQDGQFLYSPLLKTYRRLDIDHDHVSRVVVHKPSFLSLKDISGGGAKVLNVRSSHLTS